ncbi:phospholipase A2 [Trichonephila inaurata madagascariensis]|uniref:Phospholipase A2 n=1 Tax=Trichonephila inaurata madagascariensis TaxID=2747483 RepID=A0A8X6XYE4_9ARAC|nr:phospholipase A2 [Trichonephila inaurata madagascariensis]
MVLGVQYVILFERSFDKNSNTSAADIQFSLSEEKKSELVRKKTNDSKNMGFLVTLLVFTACCCAPILGSFSREKVFVLQDPDSQDNRTLVVVTWIDEEGSKCQIFNDKRLSEEVMKSSKENPVRKPSKEELREILDECTLFSLRRRRRDADDNEYDSEDDEEYSGPKRTTTPKPTTESSNGWNVIFPGTKWCGAGDIAKHDEDLGFHQDTDRCCRAHDKCDDLIEGGGTKYNLTNKSPFTALSCKCDDDFYNCLSRINSITSNTIGNTYFNVLKRPCYELDYPKTKKCKKYKTFLKLKCVEYEVDKKKPKVYQWKPAKRYKKLPFPGPLTVTLPF